MIPRLSVTSAARLRPVILRTLFSFSLPFRYWITSTLVSIGPHSMNPASGPSVWPVPRSTRKLNCAYGRSRRTAISASFVRGFRGRPNGVVESELQLLVGDAALHRIERGAGPATRPRAHEEPCVDDVPAGSVELLDGDVPPLVLPVGEPLAPVVQLRRPRQRAAQDDRLETVVAVVGRRGDIRLGRDAADLAEAELAASDQDAEVARSQQRPRRAIPARRPL